MPFARNAGTRGRHLGCPSPGNLDIIRSVGAVDRIVGALRAAGLDVRVLAHRDAECELEVAGYPHRLRLFAWNVSDNGAATGRYRPADERRIQAQTSRLFEDSGAETLVLGWAGRFSHTPVIVAFNPIGVIGRANSKLRRKLAQGERRARVSDSQQFRQDLMDHAAATGFAVGENQHGEAVAAMRPERFLDYLSGYKPERHIRAFAHLASAPGYEGMEALVEDAAAEEEDDPPWTGGPPAPVLAEFDPGQLDGGREQVARQVALRRGQRAFRAMLMAAYGGSCVITGSEVEPALEAAHIVPFSGPSSNHPANGLLLRADVHTLFDLGLISVDPETLNVHVSERLSGTEYERYRGQPLRPPQREDLSPSPRALRRHFNSAEL